MRSLLVLAFAATALAGNVWVAPAHKDPSFYDVEGARSAHLAEVQRRTALQIAALKDANTRFPEWVNAYRSGWSAPVSGWTAPVVAKVVAVPASSGWSAPVSGWSAPSSGWTAPVVAKVVVPASGWSAPSSGWTAPASGWSAPTPWALPVAPGYAADVAAERQAHLSEVARLNSAAVAALSAAASRGGDDKGKWW